ncbi:MAG TPA: alpha/beta hydrolase [Tepidisphaeraceae bacterium]|nr:alpha/beta hydrolase [Tepidisphaeraceae bacterium]
MPATAIILKLLLLALVLVFVGAMVVVGTIWAMAVFLLKPERMSDAKALFHLRRLSPSDLGLPYEEIFFPIRDAQSGKPMKLTGWWIPAEPDSPAGRTALVLHGYSDAKVGGLAWAPLFRSLGFNVLAVDLRAHGESGGKYTTAGFFEREDIRQVIDQLRARWPAQSRQLVLFGASLGAAVACAVAAERDDLDALILECPYFDFPHAVLSHAGRLGVPGRTFQTAALRVSQFIAGIDYSQVRPIDMIPKITCPLWAIFACDDPFVPPPDRAALVKAVRERGGQVWEVEAAYHIMGMIAEPAEYQRRMREFLAPVLAERPLESRVVS